MPSWALFDRQDEAYRQSVLPPRRSRPGSPSSRPPRWAGSATRRRAPSSACPPSAPRPPSRSCCHQVRLHPRGGPRHRQGADRPARRLTGGGGPPRSPRPDWARCAPPRRVDAGDPGRGQDPDALMQDRAAVAAGTLMSSVRPRLSGSLRRVGPCRWPSSQSPGRRRSRWPSAPPAGWRSPSSWASTSWWPPSGCTGWPRRWAGQGWSWRWASWTPRRRSTPRRPGSTGMSSSCSSG